MLKYTTRSIAVEETPSHTSKTYRYKDSYKYYIKSDERVEDIKKLTAENILICLPAASAHNAWIKENNINFKNEKDIVQFLVYYNGRLSN